MNASAIGFYGPHGDEDLTLPRRADETMITGKVGAGITVEQGYEAARLCGLICWSI